MIEFNGHRLDHDRSNKRDVGKLKCVDCGEVFLYPRRNIRPVLEKLRDEYGSEPPCIRRPSL